MTSGEFPRSVHLMALLGSREAGAEGFTIQRLNPVTGQREVKSAWGAAIPESVETGVDVAAFPLHAGEELEGAALFVFRGAIQPWQRAILERIAAAIEEVWRLSLLPNTYAQSAARIGELETKLADSKIADRVRGLLATDRVGGAVDVIVRHVESVLRPGQVGPVLAQITQETEQEIAERELTNRAKAVLQSRYGMSEDQAHVHLRVVSRKSRKRLCDVARAVLEEQVVQHSV